MTTPTSTTPTSPAATSTVPRRAPLTGPNKIGLVLAGLLGAADCTALFNQTPPGEVGPPVGILALDTALGLITVVAVIIAWRTRNRGVVRLAAGARILSMITALPAFFAGVPAFLVALVAVIVVLTVTAVVLMLLPPRRSVV